MRRVLGKVWLAAAALGLAGAAFTAVAQAQTALTLPMTGTGAANASLTGTATITPVGANQVRVDITVNGLAANSGHAAHIHSPGTMTAACDTNGPVVYPLTDVMADASGKGTSTSTVTFDSTKGIPTNGWYVNVHQMASTAGTGAGIICAPIKTSLASSASGAAGAGGASALPPAGTGGMATRDSHNAALELGLLAAAITLGGTGLVLARRRG